MKHIHHIIPKHMGGTNDPSNLVKLTPRQHALAHKKLYEQHGNWQDWCAWKGLSGQMKKEEILERIYKINGKRNYHHMHTKQAREKMKMSKIGTKLTDEWKKKISKSLMGRVVTESHRKKTAQSVSKEYIITDPKGKIFEITNLLDFARKHKLDQGNLTKVAQNKLNSHKGYKVSYK